MLTNADETLLHQTSRPMSTCAESDHRFFDRYWFEAVHPEGYMAVILGMGAYKNMNVMDGFAAVQQDLQQYNLRVSRRLRPDLDHARVGPLSVNIVEPYRDFILTIEKGDYAFSGELRWQSNFPPYLEAHHQNLVEGSIAQDSSRYDQVGRVSGWLELNGTRHIVTDWWGVRDHSWGVRPGVGGFEPQRKDTGDNLPGTWIEMRSLLWMWSYLVTEEFACQFQQQEDGEGKILYQDGLLQWPIDSTRKSVRVVGLEHQISFIPGTRSYHDLTYVVSLEDSNKLEIKAEPLVPPWAYRGTGYEGGYNDGKGLGATRGNDLLEWDIYDLSHPGIVLDQDGNQIAPGHREQPVKLTVNGQAGFGHFPVMSFGKISKYNLK
jgi:hypothetical protein